MARFGADTRYPNEYNIVNESLDPMGTMPRGPGALMGGDAESQAVIEDMLMGRGNQYSPEGLDAGPMFPEEGLDPQDYIQQILAGDVVPMRTNPVATSGTNMRLGTPGVGARSQGVQSINNLGGSNSPYIDLLNVLAYPIGGSMAPRIGR